MRGSRVSGRAMTIGKQRFQSRHNFARYTRRAPRLDECPFKTFHLLNSSLSCYIVAPDKQTPQFYYTRYVNRQHLIKSFELKAWDVILCYERDSEEWIGHFLIFGLA